VSACALSAGKLDRFEVRWGRACQGTYQNTWRTRLPPAMLYFFVGSSRAAIPAIRTMSETITYAAVVSLSVIQVPNQCTSKLRRHGGPDFSAPPTAFCLRQPLFCSRILLNYWHVAVKPCEPLALIHMSPVTILLLAEMPRAVISSPCGPTMSLKPPFL
jgi:hypothetical protein